MLASYPMVSRAVCLVRLATGVPTTRSSNPLHSENAIWKVPKSALKNVMLVRRARSRVALVRDAEILESHRFGGPGVIGEFHIRREPVSWVFQNSMRCSSISGFQKARSAAPHAE